MRLPWNHFEPNEKPPLSRRRFLTQVTASLTGVSLLSLYGCQSGSNRPASRITTVPQLRQRPRPQIPVIAETTHKWAPLPSVENSGQWQAIVIHHTATPTGSASAIDILHKKRGFDGLGYDFIINNGQGNPDGLVEVGYRWRNQLVGAHCRPENCIDNYWNTHAIGIALVGNFEIDHPTDRQYGALEELVLFLKQRYAIVNNQIWGHKQVPGSNTKCPGRHFSWNRLHV